MENQKTIFTIGNLQIKAVANDYILYELNGAIRKAKLYNNIKFKAYDKKWYFLYDAKLPPKLNKSLTIKKDMEKELR